jgi:hypothetical protein
MEKPERYRGKAEGLSMLRYLNMFVLIGIALVGISIAGFATGNRFLTEPGQARNPQGSLIYLGAGIIMLVNGVVSVRTAGSAAQHESPATARPKSGKPA